MFLGTALMCVPAPGFSQQADTAPAQTQDDGSKAKQDMHHAGQETKAAAHDTGNGVKHGTEKAYHSTKHGTKEGMEQDEEYDQGRRGRSQRGSQAAPVRCTQYDVRRLLQDRQKKEPEARPAFCRRASGFGCKVLL